ncbi:MAG TPA: enoyl-CoA hydratase-related protein [Ruminiclostridium sp.]|nr:enoyl-CoA hydratase-related protein [Ruminiclostridium sp.]
MDFRTLLVEENQGVINVIFNRPAEKNSINIEMLSDINKVLDYAEKNNECKMIVLQGSDNYFCSGMDFKEFSQSSEAHQGERRADPYMQTIKRFSLIPKIVVSKVDGKVTAGGVGFVAASDYVVATECSQFSLPEALWGLLPAMVLPYLIRRVGFQKAYSMTLTTQSISAEEAYSIHLVDNLTKNPDQAIHRLWLRLRIINESTLKYMKEYFRKLWIINNSVEDEAVRMISTLLSDPKTQENIKNFVEQNKLPWELDEL